MAIGTAAAIALGVGALGSAAIGASAASKAGKAQVAAADKGVEEQRAAREEMRRLLEPYVAAGNPALEAQMGALGLRGPEAQQAYVAEQEQSPIFQALARQQEEAILQNASATGGLRGGNVQGALAQFRPALLNQFLEQQYGKLGGMTALGQQSAAGVGTAGMQSAGAIADLFGQAGAARAGSALGVGQALSGPFNLLSTLGGMSASKSMGYAPPVQPRGF
jgi:hypothetical protein